MRPAQASQPPGCGCAAACHHGQPADGSLQLAGCQLQPTTRFSAEARLARTLHQCMMGLDAARMPTLKSMSISISEFWYAMRSINRAVRAIAAPSSASSCDTRYYHQHASKRTLSTSLVSRRPEVAATISNHHHSMHCDGVLGIFSSRRHEHHKHPAAANGFGADIQALLSRAQPLVLGCS